MKEIKFIFGPVPSRRLGLSLGVSPIPQKTCNYSCIYCQLGRTRHLRNAREMFFPVESMIDEFEQVLQNTSEYDVITIVGEGEPTLYAGLGSLVDEIHRRTDKPVALITNGALFYCDAVRQEAAKADIVLPSMDAYDEASFRQINRAYGSIKFEKVFTGLKKFADSYQGKLWLEIMMIKDINDSDYAIEGFFALLQEVKYDRLYLNTPIRPPAEPDVEAVEHDRMLHAVDKLGGISLEMLQSQGFHSGITDHYEAVLSIIKRHPMNQYEIKIFLEARGCSDEAVWNRLIQDANVENINYKGIITCRLK